MTKPGTAGYCPSLPFSFLSWHSEPQNSVLWHSTARICLPILAYYHLLSACAPQRTVSRGTNIHISICSTSAQHDLCAKNRGEVSLPNSQIPSLIFFAFPRPQFCSYTSCLLYLPNPNPTPYPLPPNPYLAMPLLKLLTFDVPFNWYLS